MNVSLVRFVFGFAVGIGKELRIIRIHLFCSHWREIAFVFVGIKGRIRIASCRQIGASVQLSFESVAHSRVPARDTAVAPHSKRISVDFLHLFDDRFVSYSPDA